MALWGISYGHAAACNNKATYEIILCDVHSTYVHVSRPHYRCAGYLFIFLSSSVFDLRNRTPPRPMALGG